MMRSQLYKFPKADQSILRKFMLEYDSSILIPAYMYSIIDITKSVRQKLLARILITSCKSPLRANKVYCLIMS